VVEDLRPGEHPAGVEHEVAQQPELGRGQLDGTASPPDLVGVLVERQVREPQDRLGRDRAGAAQHGADPGRELLQSERLGDVVVAADGEAGDLVLRGVLRGQEDHRDPVPVPAQPPDDLEPIHVGQHHVEDDQVVPVLAGEAERLPAAVGGGHAEAEEPQ
jgi:hypothetical protein